MVIPIDDVINEQLVLLDIPETERDMTIEAMAGRLEADGRLSDPGPYVVHESFRNRPLEVGTPAAALESSAKK